MPIKLKNFKTKKIIIHGSLYENSDTSLCGNDLIQDGDIFVGQRERTNDAINCGTCKRIIEFYKKLSETSISDETITQEEWFGN